ARPIGGRGSGALGCDTRETGKGKGETLSLEEIIIRHALDMPIPTLEREAQASGVMMIPVPGPGVLRDVRGVNAAGAVPLIESVEITAHPGQTLVPWPEGSRYLGFIFARGETSEAVEAALRAGHANPACTDRSEYSSGVTNCRATAWSECFTSIPRSRSTCTARTTQRRQKAPVPSTYAPLKNVVLNAKTPSLFNVLRISAMTCA